MKSELDQDLKRLFQPFREETIETVLRLRKFIWDLFPETNELIYDNYNALAFGWSTTDKMGQVFCTISAWRSNNAVHFGFYYGNELDDPEKILLGGGRQYRYILVPEIEKFPAEYIRKLAFQAHAYSLTKVKKFDLAVKGSTIIKSSSVKKRGST